MQDVWPTVFLRSWRIEYSGLKCFCLKDNDIETILFNSNCWTDAGLKKIIKLRHPLFYRELVRGLAEENRDKRDLMLASYRKLNYKYTGSLSNARV